VVCKHSQYQYFHEILFEIDLFIRDLFSSEKVDFVIVVPPPYGQRIKMITDTSSLL